MPLDTRSAFLSSIRELPSAPATSCRLFRRAVKPGIDNLFFIGLAQPLPTLVNFVSCSEMAGRADGRKLRAACHRGDAGLDCV